MRPFSIKEAIINAWSLWRGNWRILVAVALLNLAVQLLPRASDFLGTGVVKDILSKLTIPASAVAGIFVSVGSMKIVLMLVSGQRPQLTALFSPWKLVARWVLVMIVTGLVSLVVAFLFALLPVFAPGSFNNPFGLVLRVVYALPFLYLWVRLSLASWAVIDGAGVRESLGRSWQMTKGQVIRLLVFGAALILVVFGIGFVAATPAVVGTLLQNLGVSLAVRTILIGIGLGLMTGASVLLIGPLSLLSIAGVYRKLSPKPQ